MYRDARLNA